MINLVALSEPKLWPKMWILPGNSKNPIFGGNLTKIAVTQSIIKISIYKFQDILMNACSFELLTKENVKTNKSLIKDDPIQNFYFFLIVHF